MVLLIEQEVPYFEIRNNGSLLISSGIHPANPNDDTFSITQFLHNAGRKTIA